MAEPFSCQNALNALLKFEFSSAVPSYEERLRLFQHRSSCVEVRLSLIDSPVSSVTSTMFTSVSLDSFHERGPLLSDGSNKRLVGIEDTENSVPETRGKAFHLPYLINQHQTGAGF